jgi:uncharacterized membrane protein
MKIVVSLASLLVVQGAQLQFGGAGELMSENQKLRRLGWIQLVLGVLLAAFGVIASVNLGPDLLQPGVSRGGTTFTGTVEQGRLILLLFAWIVAFGLIGMLNGIWQIKTGRRNKVILVIFALVVVSLVLTTWRVSSALG